MTNFSHHVSLRTAAKQSKITTIGSILQFSYGTTKEEDARIVLGVSFFLLVLRLRPEKSFRDRQPMLGLIP